MIDLTVKTLDSNNHAFSMPDDATVQQLKAKIEESMNIPANRQRLIFHGRVMQDDKKLSEYEVHGMVIHLVKSQPPQPGSRASGGSGSSASSGTNSSDTSNRFTRPRYYGRVDGSTMFGSVVIPVLGGGRHENRAWRLMSLADRMVQRAVEVLDNHENSASRSASATASVTTTPYNSSRDSSGSHSPTTEQSQSGRAPCESRTTSSTATATQPPAAETEMDTESNAGTPFITVSSADQTAAPSSSTSGPSTGATGGSTQEGPAQDSNQPRQQRGSPSTSNMAALLTKLRALQNRFNPLLTRYHNLIAEDSPTSNPQQLAERVAMTQTVPEVLHLLSHAYHAVSELSVDWEAAPPRQMRPLIAPAIQQLVQLTEGMNPWGLTIPPQSFGQQAQTAASTAAAPAAAASTGSSTSSAAGAQAAAPSTPAGGVSEVTYMTTTFPAEGGEATTTFTTRPAADFEAAAATAAAPNRTPVVAASIDFSGARHQGLLAALDAAYAIGNRLVAHQVGQQPQQQPQQQQQQQQQQQPQQPQQASQQASQQQQDQPQQHLPPMSGLPRGSSIVTLPVGMVDIPANVEFFMEVGPSTITIDSVDATVVTGGSFTPGTNGAASDGNPLNINFPWGSPPPQEFLNSVAQALNRIITTTAGPNPNMRRRGSAPESSQNAGSPRRGSAPESEGSEPSGPAGTAASSSPGATSGQTSQARGYTATHPTTSTQTRSTARPHVHHIASTQFPGYSVGYTDPFLPCHSQFFASWHRSRPSTNNGAQAAPNDTAQASANQSAGTQTSANAGSRPSARSASATSAASTSTSQPTSGSATGSATATSQSSSQSHGAFRDATPPITARESLLNLVQSIAGVVSSPGNDAIRNALNSLVAARNQGNQEEVPIINWVAPQAEDQEGESLLSDLRRAVVRSVTVSDLVALSESNWDAVNHTRSDLRQFVIQRLCEGSPTEERLEQGVNLLLNEIRPHFDIMLEGTLRDDIDAASTLNRFHESVVPEFLKLVLDEERASTFGQNLHDMVDKYLGRLWAIVKHCCANDDAIDAVFQACVNRMPVEVPRAYLSQLRMYTDEINVSPQDIEPFIVYCGNSSCTASPLESVPLIPTSINSEPSSSSANLKLPREEPQAQKSDSRDLSEPMDTNPQSPSEATTSGAASLNTLSQRNSSEEAVTAKPPAMDTEVPPVPTPEAWHRILPPEWVPIIARDTTRQRRSNSQTPLSDAYLAGMPPKRRKVVTADKPQGSLGEVISANMETAIQTSGVPTAGISLVQEEAGSDPRLREAYREQLRATVRANLANNPDFSPERFPNAAQYFGKS